MKREAQITLGLFLISCGVGGLFVINVWLLPAQGIAATPSAPVKAQPSHCPSATQAPVATAKAPVASVTASATSVAASASASSAAPSSGLAPIVFDKGKTATSKALMAAVLPIADYLKRDGTAKIVLVGHGDEGASPRDFVEVGKVRAFAVKRGLVDLQISPVRVSVEPPTVDGEQFAQARKQAGMVQVKVVGKDGAHVQ